MSESPPERAHGAFAREPDSAPVFVGAVAVHPPLAQRQELGRKCVPRGGRFRVVGALQVVIFEEWAHNQYASRDLTHLEADIAGA